MDGAPMDTGTVMGWVGSGTAVVCPNGCNYINANGQFTKFWAWANGTSGYYPVYGAGSLQYSIFAAAKAAINYINQTSQDEVREYAGEIYEDDNGIYSFTQPRPGTIDRSWVNPNAIPKGTSFVGDYHTHPGAPGYDSENFSEQDKTGAESYAKRYPDYYITFLGTPTWQIKPYYPRPLP
jgi:hypothetical protein